MEAVLLIVAVLAAGLACPAKAWWQRRRGRDAACCALGPVSGEQSEADALRERQRELAARVSALAGDGTPAGRGTA